MDFRLPRVRNNSSFTFKTNFEQEGPLFGLNFMTPNLKELVSVAAQFDLIGEIIDVREYGSGNVNDTFLVTTNCRPSEKTILQRINPQVFKRPELIIANMVVFSEHVHARLASEQTTSSRKWETPKIVPAKNGKNYYVDPENFFWRMIGYIDSSISFEKIESTEHAEEVGFALGKFHHLTSDLDPNKLHDTLVGFHIIPQYLQYYDKAADNTDKQSTELKYCREFISRRREDAWVLENAKQNNILIIRPTHGDPKASNVLFDKQTEQAIGLIDLDTVKPGLIQYDIGDCLRSCCNPAGEESRIINDVYFETDLCQAILKGYFSEADRFFSVNDYNYLYDSIRLLTFELGLRFLTDYLEGNIYFKTKLEEHNLWRALNQFKLTETIETQKKTINAIINDFRRLHNSIQTQ